jgi:hypothetical protein
MLRVSTRASFTTIIALLVLFAGWVTSAAAGTLKVTSFPTGAQVIVDGVNTGKLTPMNISLADGDHVVTVLIPNSGWNADTRTVTIAAGNNDLSVTLLPMVTAGPPGPKGDKGDKGDRGDQGVPGADAPGATRADGPCFDNVNRYVDCGNGTVTDNLTGVIWLKQANCFPPSDWPMANQAAASLKHGDCGLMDQSSPGDWRLPTREEWEPMIVRKLSGVATLCIPALVSDAWSSCYGDGTSSSFEGVAAAIYWSATPSQRAALAGGLYLTSGAADLGNGISVTIRRTLAHLVWPVRGGSR